jgi:hypothetical protein
MQTRTSAALPLAEPDVRISRIRLSSRTTFPPDMHPACSAGFGLAAQLLSRLPMDSTAVAASSVLGIRQSALVASDSACSQPRPLRSTVVTRFIATMGLSDCRPQHPAWLLIPKPSSPLHEASAAAAALPSSRRFCPRALSPFTPGNPRRASNRSSVRILASPPLAGWPFPLTCNEAESSSLNTTARAFASPGFAGRITPSPTRVRLHDFRFVITVSTFHLTRTAKLSWRTRGDGVRPKNPPSSI